MMLLLMLMGVVQAACPNEVPSEKIEDTLERSLTSQLAGHDRARAAVLAAVKRQLRAWSSGRSSSVRLHLTGPSGVGKSFIAKLIANSYFEESDAYTGYRAAGALGGVAASAAFGTQVAASVGSMVAASVTSMVGAMIAVPLSAVGAGYVGWRLVEFGESYWGTPPQPFPTQCGVAWWKFGLHAEPSRDVEKAFAAAARALLRCPHTVLIFEDVNRLPPTALSLLERLTVHNLRAAKKTVSLDDAVIIITSDVYATNASVLILEESMTSEEAEAVVDSQSRAMWGSAPPPPWWTRSFATLPLIPLDDRDLKNAVNLYLKFDVVREVRDALRYEFVRRQAPTWYPLSWFDQNQEWDGTVAFDERVIDHVYEFVRAGPDDWRCHAITHFHTSIVEPTIDDAVALLLRESHVDDHSLASSLLMTLHSTLVNQNTPLQRHVLNVQWTLVDLSGSYKEARRDAK